MSKENKKILFVCKWNRFRSKIAEAFFKKYNKNRSYKAKSAGIIRGHYPLSKYQVAVAKEFGIKLAGKPRGLDIKLMRWQNTIVIVADDVPPSLFKKSQKNHNKKLIVWKIPDVKNNNKEEIRKTIKMIYNKVRNLVKKLK